jgi:hypothetical protein
LLVVSLTELLNYIHERKELLEASVEKGEEGVPALPAPVRGESGSSKK